MRRVAIILVVPYYTFACSRNTCECMKRTEEKTPNFPQPGDYRFVDYVLLHNGQKIQATCDLKAVGRLDSAASCGLPTRFANAPHYRVGNFLGLSLIGRNRN